jgi:hypothetical protein
VSEIIAQIESRIIISSENIVMEGEIILPAKSKRAEYLMKIE